MNIEQLRNLSDQLTYFGLRSSGL